MPLGMEVGLGPGDFVLNGEPARPPPFREESWVTIQHKVACAEACLHTKWHLDLSSHLAATDMGRKLGGYAPLGEGELGPHLTQCGQGQGLPACQVSS